MINDLVTYKFTFLAKKYLKPRLFLAGLIHFNYLKI